MLNIWKEVLQIEDITINDHFFEIGGNSLNIVSIQAAIEKKFGIKIPIIELFEYPTVAHLAAFLQKLKTEQTTPPQIKTPENMDIEDKKNAVAIIGMAGRFPGAENIEEFWYNLYEGTDSISRFSEDELIAMGVPASIFKMPHYVRAKGVLKNVEYFDADFFGFSAIEAQITDPQHRLFLECAWEALENAGYCSDNYSGIIGVYGGTGASSYYLNHIYPNQKLKEKLGEYFIQIGNDKDYLTTRVSYKLNLKGPSVAVQTACSTSLVAICLASDHLLANQCDIAIAGSASISLPQEGYIWP